jgi:hypothetical protein
MIAKPPLLQAFRQPWVLLSILVLLLNDHILKSSVPSWLTGKLSDFVGLFFFPFLLGVIIQGAVKLARRGKARQPKAKSILLSAMLASAGFFAMVKLIPEANGAVSALLATLFGLPAPIALDPSDLIALLVFIPAWRLWQRVEQPAAPIAPGKLAYAALALGAVASLATQPCPPIFSVKRVNVYETTVYASNMPGTPKGWGYTTSADRGKTWTWVTDPSTELVQALNTPVTLPKTLCDPANPQTCYRITGQEQVEESQDSGQTWKTSWQIPPGRESYMKRIAAGTTLLYCGKTPDFSPYDLVFLPGEGPSTLMVAMGNEGFLLHAPGQSWQRSPMMFLNPDGTPQSYSPNPRPTPFQAASLSEALVTTQPEWWLALGGGALVYLGFSLWAAIYAVRRPAPPAGRGARWVFAPALWLCAWLVFLGFIWLVYNWHILPNNLNDILSLLDLFGAISIVPFILLVSAIIWQRAGKLTTQPARFYALVLGVLLLAGLVALSIVLSSVLWALGLIVTYELAMGIASAFSLSLLVAGVILQRRMLRQQTA